MSLRGHCPLLPLAGHRPGVGVGVGGGFSSPVAGLGENERGTPALQLHHRPLQSNHRERHPPAPQKCTRTTSTLSLQPQGVNPSPTFHIPVPAWGPRLCPLRGVGDGGRAQRSTKESGPVHCMQRQRAISRAAAVAGCLPAHQGQPGQGRAGHASASGDTSLGGLWREQGVGQQGNGD